MTFIRYYNKAPGRFSVILCVVTSRDIELGIRHGCHHRTYIRVAWGAPRHWIWEVGARG